MQAFVCDCQDLNPFNDHITLSKSFTSLTFCFLTLGRAFMSNGCKACKMGPGTLGMPLRNVSATHIKALPLDVWWLQDVPSWIQPICYEQMYNTQPLHLLTQPTFWSSLLICLYPSNASVNTKAPWSSSDLHKVAHTSQYFSLGPIILGLLSDNPNLCPLPPLCPVPTISTNLFKQ